MIAEVLNIIKKNLFLISLILLISLLSFQLGRISKTASQPIKIEKAAVEEIFGEAASKASVGRGGAPPSLNKEEGRVDFRVVVSKKSTSKKYHFLWCSGAKQIKEENKIYFNSESAAISAGYVLAINCLK